MLTITPALVLPDHEIEERFVRASGPGGQNVNKVATAVQLRFDVHASSLPDDVKARVLAVLGGRLTEAGVLVIDAREHRSQAKNREAARERLVAVLQRAIRKPRPRRATRPTTSSREQRVTAKKRRAVVKRSRGRTRGDDE